MDSRTNLSKLFQVNVLPGQFGISEQGLRIVSAPSHFKGSMSSQSRCLILVPTAHETLQSDHSPHIDQPVPFGLSKGETMSVQHGVQRHFLFLFPKVICNKNNVQDLLASNIFWQKKFL